jgi:hypothetical protein
MSACGSTPALHMSAAFVYNLPWIISGAGYAGDPQTVPSVGVPFLKPLLSPKSIRRMLSCRSSKTFSAFRSRCATNFQL